MSALKLGNWKKITPADAAEIAVRVAAGETMSSLAREYGIAHQTVSFHCKNAKITRDRFVEYLREAAAQRRRGNLADAAEALIAAAHALNGSRVVMVGRGDAPAVRASMADAGVALLADHCGEFQWTIARNDAPQPLRKSA